MPNVNRPDVIERIEKDVIVLNGKGHFPRKLVIVDEPAEKLEYRIIKTKQGKYQLTKQSIKPASNKRASLSQPAETAFKGALGFLFFWSIVKWECPTHQGNSSMARSIKDLNGFVEATPFSKNQVYKMVRNPDNPLPHKKIGKKLYFDMERFYRWFDGMPGADKTFNSEG